MYNIILVFTALAINECQGQCHFCMCVEVSDWVQMSPADQCMQICVFQTRHGTTPDCFRLLMYSALPLRRQHIYGKDEQHSIFAASTQMNRVKRKGSH